jgi:hypothetical protein
MATLHPFHGFHRWIIGQRSNFCTKEALSPTLREIGPAILCHLRLNAHSHSQSNVSMHARLPDPNQQDQHSPTSVGGQSWSSSLSTLDGCCFATKNECTLKPPLARQCKQIAHSITMLDISDIQHHVIRVCIQFTLHCRSEFPLHVSLNQPISPKLFEKEKK